MPRSPHLTAWPPRWACGPSRAWPGSSRPPPRAAARRRGVTRGEGRRPVRRPLARSFIHSSLGRPGPRRAGEGAAAPPGGATQGGRARPASDRPGTDRCRRQPRPTHHGPRAPAPRSRHGRPGTGSRLHRPRHPTSGTTGSKTPQRGEGARAATEAPRRLRAACCALWRREAGRASLPPIRLAPALCR